MNINPRDPKNIAIAALSTALLGGSLWAFQPWLLFVDKPVDDVLPVSVTQQVAAPMSPEAAASTAAGEQRGATTEVAQAAPAETQTGPVVLNTGQFISHEHETTGTASIIRNENGQHQLVFENLNTSNGPDVHVWVSAGEVVEGLAGFKSADAHERIDLGVIKGNKGNQVYDLPADFDASKWKSIDLWCDRFNVSFGAAPLNAV